MSVQYSDLHVAKLNALTTEQLAYIAGIFDGEGCIRLHIGPRSTSVRLTIVTTNPGLIQWLQTVTGFGSVHHYPSKKPNCRDCWHWHVASRQAIAVATALRPWLIVKAPEVDVLLEYAALEKADGARTGLRVTPERIERRNVVVDKLRVLKRA